MRTDVTRSVCAAAAGANCSCSSQSFKTPPEVVRPVSEAFLRSGREYAAVLVLMDAASKLALICTEQPKLAEVRRQTA